MTGQERKAYKARQLRYKKPIAKNLNYDYILEDLWDMQYACEDIQWFESDEDSLVNALDGDEDEAYEFKMAFADLSAELETFSEDIQNEYIPKYFDVFFPAVGCCDDGLLGWDSYEGDYYPLNVYQAEWAKQEAVKKIMSLTKKELLEVINQCLCVFREYVAVKYRYDCLKSAIDILRDQNMDRIKTVKAIEEQYEIANEASDGFRYEYSTEVRKLESLLLNVPQEYWIQ